MGSGLQHATLEALCTRAPWRGRRWILTAADVRDVYAAIGSGADPWTARHKFMDVAAMERALQLLRKSGLIEYAGTPKRWRIPGEVTP